MINAYQEIVSHNGFDFEDYLSSLSLMYIFEPLFEYYEDKEVCKKIIKYIAYTHSLESNKLTVGGDRRKEINKVFKDLGIEDEYYEDVVLLKNEIIVRCCQRWMQFMDARQTEYLFTLQNAYVQQQAASLSTIRKASGEIDYDQKMRCIENMSKIKIMIKDAESELQQNDPKLKEAHEELKKSTKGKSTLTATEAFKI